MVGVDRFAEGKGLLAQIRGLADPIVRASGGEIVDLEFKPDSNGWVLRIFVEKLGSAEKNLSTEESAVDLEICSTIARDLSPALDVADIIPHAYNLEVGSPGVERPLRGAQDFVRFAGKKAKIKMTEPVALGPNAKQRVLVGLLGPVEGESFTLLEVSGMREPAKLPLSGVESARLVFEFGPTPKPGKKGARTATGRLSAKSRGKGPSSSHSRTVGEAASATPEGQPDGKKSVRG